MTKYRLIILFTTFIVMTVMGTIAILYARGYRLNNTENQVSLGPTGLLVANSDPKAAQVYIDGELKTATDNTISLTPGRYQVEIKKEGYQAWSKEITIQREAVTQVDAYLLPNAPSLTALTFTGAQKPILSKDYSKIIYVVPPNEENQSSDKEGLWIIESVNLPLGFNRDPRQITDGDLQEASFQFSPDGRQVLVNLENNYYLLDTGSFTPQQERLPISEIELENLLDEWKEESQNRLLAKLAPMPDELEEVFIKSAEEIQFSPDENRILYTATASAYLKENLVPKLPGSSTQKEERSIQESNVYVYDVREDKNFKVAEKPTSMYWLANSLNLVDPREDGIYILDYDGTNRKKIFSDIYEFPHAYPTTSGNRILILTNFASAQEVTNLYWLSLK